MPTKSNRYGSRVASWASSESAGGNVRAKFVIAWPERSCSLVSMWWTMTSLLQP